MDTVIGRFAPQAFALLRIVAGLLYACHGSQKLLGWPPAEGGGGGSLPPLMIVAGIIELVGGLLIAVGLLAGWAAFIASGEMAVAFFMAHFPRGPIPLQNKRRTGGGLLLSLVVCGCSRSRNLEHRFRDTAAKSRNRGYDFVS